MITTNTALKEYALRKLGYPVMNVEIATDQQNDCLDDALQMFAKYHFDGTREEYLLLQLTAGTRTYNLTTEFSDVTVLEVVGVSPEISQITEEPTFNFKWDFMQEKMWFGHLDLSGYRFLQEKISLINWTFQKRFEYSFNYSTQALTFHEHPKDNIIVMLKTYVINSPDSFSNIYDNDWLKKYLTALFRIQQGTNLSKYTNAPLPGGANLNAEAILQRGLDEKEKLEVDLEERYQEPIDIVIG